MGWNVKRNLTKNNRIAIEQMEILTSDRNMGFWNWKEKVMALHPDFPGDGRRWQA